jgi:hypothetical protein
MHALAYLRRNHIALLALFFALGGTSIAAVNALPNGIVGAKQLKKNAVISTKIKNGAVSGSKIADNSVTGTDVLESSLGKVPLAANADNAAHATAADNAGHAAAADNAGHATAADNAVHAGSADRAAPTGPAGGALAGSYPSPAIAADAIGASQIQAKAVRASELAGIVDREGNASVPAGALGSAEVQCAAGERLVGGGNDGFAGMFVVASRLAGPNGWTVFAANTTGSAHNLKVHAYCLVP